MNRSEDQYYLEKAEEIRPMVYDFYRLSDREDLVMEYEMKQEKIYSFVYADFRDSLNERSRLMLIKQYEEAKAMGKIVLFIRDEDRRKYKSFII